ncbi:hypothetical protein CKM354_000790000 [Cercospora kikuchii]|uniref:Uncharacterized protein n=1 Tax=Cercospora kikuchii TaxID=84275 RepID=A0A9P3CHW9_9PEZI|nr:uncharacterized protein CKM354_000790000 [Cercospora kikuchii]GIZ44709.1 hypothetical protein CKM354_000790000 [Cercospora kikuchii]
MAELTCQQLKELLDAADRRTDAVSKELATAKGHLKNVLQVLKAREMLLILPMATVLYILNDTREPAKMFQRRMEDALRYEFAWPFQDVEENDTEIDNPNRYRDTRSDGELWFKDRQQYFEHLAILSRLEPSGVAFAIEKAILCAMKEFDGYWPSRDNGNLRNID